MYRTAAIPCTITAPGEAHDLRQIRNLLDPWHRHRHRHPAPLPAADTIKIGVAGAHSGDLASYGLPTVKATELVAKEINARGGIGGRQVELLIEDDVCKPEMATNTATKLISMGARVVIGHICSGATKAALPIYKDAGVIVISPSATNTDLTLSGDYPNFYRTIFSDNIQARTIVDFTVKDLHAKKSRSFTTRGLRQGPGGIRQNIC